MRVLFLAPHSFRPPERKGLTTISFKPGWSGTVRRVCGEEAVRKGKAVEIEYARRG